MHVCVTVCAHPFKAELIFKFLILKTCTNFNSTFQTMKIDSRKQREERFLYIGLSSHTMPLAYLKMFTIFLHSIQRSGLNNSSVFKHF